MKLLRERVHYFPLKIDIAKTYDIVEWRSFLQVMRFIWFDMKFITLIKECISMTTFSIMVNGVACVFSPTERITTKLPSIALSFPNHLWSFITDPSYGTLIQLNLRYSNHKVCLPYLLLDVQATLKEREAFKHALEENEHCTGQLVNYSKLAIYSASTFIESIKVLSCLGVKKMNHKEIYLGFPLFHSWAKHQIYQYLVDKIQSKAKGEGKDIISYGKNNFFSSNQCQVLSQFMRWWHLSFQDPSVKQ